MGFNIHVDTFGFIIRKLAHFTEYFILGVFLFLLYKDRSKYPMLVLIHGLITASIDESIQLFTPNRSGELRDVLIDLTGILTGLILANLIFSRIYKKK